MFFPDHLKLKPLSSLPVARPGGLQCPTLSCRIVGWGKGGTGRAWAVVPLSGLWPRVQPAQDSRHTELQLLRKALWLFGTVEVGGDLGH